MLENYSKILGIGVNPTDSKAVVLRKQFLVLQGIAMSYERKLWHPKMKDPLFKTFTARFESGLFLSAFENIAGVEDLGSFYALSISGITGSIAPCPIKIGIPLFASPNKGSSSFFKI